MAKTRTHSQQLHGMLPSKASFLSPQLHNLQMTWAPLKFESIKLFLWRHLPPKDTPPSQDSHTNIDWRINIATVSDKRLHIVTSHLNLNTLSTIPVPSVSSPAIAKFQPFQAIGKSSPRSNVCSLPALDRLATQSRRHFRKPYDKEPKLWIMVLWLVSRALDPLLQVLRGQIKDC